MGRNPQRLPQKERERGPGGKEGGCHHQKKAIGPDQKLTQLNLKADTPESPDRVVLPDETPTRRGPNRARLPKTPRMSGPRPYPKERRQPTGQGEPNQTTPKTGRGIEGKNRA